MPRENTTLITIAPFTLLTLLINAVLFAICAVRSQAIMNFDLGVLVSLGASQRELLWEGDWIRLIAPIYLHGGLIHILFNMYFLWQVGPQTEVYFGTANFGTIYLLSGVTGICLSQIFSGVVSIGASGALCGIMGAHLAVNALRCPRLRQAWRSAAVRATAYNMLFLLGIGIFGGRTLRFDNWGHFGGMLAGVALGAAFELWRNRNPFGKPVMALSLLAVAGLVCAARWTVFSPPYQIYQGAAATEELKDKQAAKMHFDAARKWAETWTPLHVLGALNRQETDNIIAAYKTGEWNLAAARQRGMRVVEVLFRRARSGVNTPDQDAQ
jgi:rhomboid protease GluP